MTRWRRYGKDRLYVDTADGVRLGWHDLHTGESHLEQPSAAEVFHTATADWFYARNGAQPGTVVPIQPRAAPTAPPARESFWERPPSDVSSPVPDARMPTSEDGSAPDREVDLANRPAGAMARAQADALRAAAPVRTFAARLLGIHTEERAWRIGADGEEKVAARLARLTREDPRWRFLHAIPVGRGGSDIDHLVIGPGGVYSLNAKHHPGAKLWVGGNTLLVNGRRQPYLRNARFEAERASTLLTAACDIPVSVTGVVVTVGADVLVKAAPEGVHVVTRRELVKWLRCRPGVLDDVTIEAIYQVACRHATWQRR